MTNKQDIFNDFDKLFSHFSLSYAGDEKKENDHLILFADGIALCRPQDHDNQVSFIVTKNINFIEDTDNKLDVKEDEYNDKAEHAQKMFEHLVGMDQVDLLNDPRLVNIVHNKDIGIFAVIKTTQDYDPIVSFLSEYLVSETHYTIEEAIQITRNQH